MAPLGRLSPARRRLYLALALLAVLVVAALTVPRLLAGDDEVDPAAQDVAGPVLLVPGYGGSTSAFSVLADHLASTGRAVELVDLGSATDEIQTQADRLRAEVGRVLDRTGAPSVDLVGYSAGGVVVRWFVAELGGDQVTRRVVTLGSPHHGTEVAELGGLLAGDACPAACLQLIPDSDLLRVLNRDDETPAGPLWVALWTLDDQTVVPPDSGSLDGALDYAVQDVCPHLHVAHADLPRSPPVWQMVDAALGGRTPVEPGPGVCRVSR